MPYSEKDDLLVGDMPLPAGFRPQKYVDDAADEIDSIIGFQYVTPVDVSETSLVVRPVRLLIKRIANLLATGRLIMATTVGRERQELHQYGYTLVREATAVLTQIANGEILLKGAALVDPLEDTDKQFTGPQIANVDAESNVEAFYDRVASPAFSYGPGESYLRRFNPDGGLIA